MVDYVPSMHEAMGSIPGSRRKRVLSKGSELVHHKVGNHGASVFLLKDSDHRVPGVFDDMSTQPHGTLGSRGTKV